MSTEFGRFAGGATIGVASTGAAFDPPRPVDTVSAPG